MTAEAKLAVASALSLPATAAVIDPRWGMAMGLGLLGGWLARAGFSLEERKGWDEIRRDGIVSILISGGSIIATLVFAKFTSADEIGVAGIGFSVALTGTTAIKILRRYVLAPIINAIKQIDGDGSG